MRPTTNNDVIAEGIEAVHQDDLLAVEIGNTVQTIIELASKIGRALQNKKIDMANRGRSKADFDKWLLDIVKDTQLAEACLSIVAIVENNE